MLVIVLVVDQDGILAVEGERDSPVPTNGYGPTSFQFALQLVQAQTGQVHVLRRFRSCESTKHEPQPASVFRTNAGPVSREKKAFDPAMPEAGYHAGIVTLRVTPSSETEQKRRTTESGRSCPEAIGSNRPNPVVRTDCSRDTRRISLQRLAQCIQDRGYMRLIDFKTEIQLVPGSSEVHCFAPNVNVTPHITDESQFKLRFVRCEYGSAGYRVVEPRQL